MDPSKQRQFLNILKAKEAEVASALNKREELEIQPEADEIDRMQNAYGRALLIDALDRNSAIRRAVRDAIDRLEKDEYGLCLECGEEINPRRLAVLPWAPLCLHCQEKADAEHESPAFAGSSLFDD